MTGFTGKRGWLALSVAGSLMVAPGVARADGLNFDNYCVMGALRVCASVRLQSVGNTLSMQVWNLQGSMGSLNTINAIGLYHTSSLYDFTGTVANYGVHYVQNGHQTNITSFWSAANNTGIKGGTDLYIGARGNNGITGCTNPGGRNVTHWSTCNSFPGVPYVQFDFTFGQNQHYDLNGVALRWNSTQVPFAGNLACDTGRNCADPSPTVGSVAPEPMTVVLLGTGLLGMGGGILTRRRHREELPTA
ncbi:MAG TPA: PEP-CTERM sorting domain-containing protein [Gemmatimonadales bacterium]|nr:PEP-CTERM sorting domain-containing protein [Gemmatimonadales bacterium]